jgi:hypothetical protein
MNCADPWRCFPIWSHESERRPARRTFGEVRAHAVQQGVTVEELLVRCIEAGLRGSQRSEEGMVPRKNARVPFVKGEGLSPSARRELLWHSQRSLCL